jgi:hypothetical protein
LTIELVSFEEETLFTPNNIYFFPRLILNFSFGFFWTFSSRNFSPKKWWTWTRWPSWMSLAFHLNILFLKKNWIKKIELKNYKICYGLLTFVPLHFSLTDFNWISIFFITLTGKKVCHLINLAWMHLIFNLWIRSIKAYMMYLLFFIKVFKKTTPCYF